MVLVALVVSGCATTNAPVLTNQEFCYSKPPIDIPSVPPLTLKPIRVKVMQLESGSVEACMTGENYTNIIENNKKIEQYIESNRLILKEYKEYYESETN